MSLNAHHALPVITVHTSTQRLSPATVTLATIATTALIWLNLREETWVLLEYVHPGLIVRRVGRTHRYHVDVVLTTKPRVEKKSRTAMTACKGITVKLRVSPMSRPNVILGTIVSGVPRCGTLGM